MPTDHRTRVDDLVAAHRRNREGHRAAPLAAAGPEPVPHNASRWRARSDAGRSQQGRVR
ncbi:hypothetical protein FHU35_16106 [Saccharopolyspora dendranthemae]|uniref:Uncharacterized protein n=1 Tax=Saccharopolyspora dendranthemae TaxID=1181886 RepID=A0A561U0F3_9PSEU|nr:hypothetical protein FHU35_16106 [Saccharopolyspora dendranthemae]